MRTTGNNFLKGVVMFCFMCLVATATAQYSILNTGFEEGLPTEWAVENGVGSAVWTHDATTGNELPATAYEGTANMLFFVDGVSTMASSKLITPKLDLTMFNLVGVGNPLLTFWYANTGRLMDGESFVDTLRVYGRAQEADAWTLLKTIDVSHDKWTKDTVALQAYANNKNYQICFEAANGNGRGVMLDEVKVIATSYCSTLPNIRITERTDSTAKISWDGSLDVKSSELKISSTPLKSMSETGDLFDGTLYVREHAITGLELGKQYYVYVRTYCDYGDYSDWASAIFEPDQAVNIPYNMDFEDWGKTSSSEYTDKPGVDTLNLPFGWEYWKGENLKSAYSSAYQYYPYRYYSTNKNYHPSGKTTGNTSLKMSGCFNTTYGIIESYAILPRLNVDSIQKLQITFKYRTGSYYYSKLKVGVVEDPSEEGAFTVVDEFTPDELGGTAVWKTVTVSFSNYKGNGKYIAIQQETAKFVTDPGKGKTETTYIDDITVDYLPECETIHNLQVKDLTSTSATVYWASNNGDYSVKISSKTAATNLKPMADIFDQRISDNEVKLTGLKPGLSYKAFVRDYCSDAVVAWNVVEFNTPVGEKDSLEIPYTQTFDGYGAQSGTSASNTTWGPLPNGWVGGKTYSSVSYIPCLTTGYKKSGTNSILLAAGSKTYKTWVATPAMKAPLNQLQVAFQGYTDNVNYLLHVGVMTDPEDVNTFECIETLKVTTKSVWEAMQVDFASYKGEGAYIAFMVNSEANADKFWIDDVVVEVAPLCKGIKDITFSNYRNDAVKVDWTPRGEESEWTFRYGPKGFDVETGGTSVKVTGTPTIQLNGLQTYTEYDVYVRAECGADGSGAWLHESFTTLTVPADPTNYVQDFSSEAENANWISVCGTNTNKWVVGTNGPITPGNPSAYPSNDVTNKPYKITKKSGSLNGWYYRTFSFKPGIYKLNFDWKGYGYSTYTYLRAFLVPGDVTFEANDFLKKYGTLNSKVPDGWTNLASEIVSNKIVPYVNQDSTSATGWHKGGDDFAITKEGIYHIAFMWVDNSTAGAATTCPVAIDNVAIVPSTCPMPQNVQVQTMTFPSTNPILTWLGGEKSEVKITTSNYATKISDLDKLQPGDAALASYGTEVTGQTFTAEGLAMKKTYYYAVRNYNATDTSKWVTGSFTTTIAVAAPFYEDFESYTSRVGVSSSTECPPFEIHAANGSSDFTYAPMLEDLLNGTKSKPTQTSVRGGTVSIKGTTTNSSQYTCETIGNNGCIQIYASDAVNATYNGSRSYVFTPYFAPEMEYTFRYDVLLITGRVADACSKNVLEDIDPATVFAFMISKDKGQTWKKEDTRIWVSNPKAYEGQGYKAVNNIADIANLGQGVYYEHIFSLDEYVGDTLQAAFYVFAGDENGATGGEYIHLDDIYMGPKPCEQPQVNEIKVTPIAGGAELSWVPGEKETEWRVKVATRFLNDNKETMENVVIDTTVLDNPKLTLKGLEAGRRYAIYLQAICDINNIAAGKSQWVGPKELQMLCPGKPTFPYVETFDDYSLGEEHTKYNGLYHPCWELRASKYQDRARLTIHRSNNAEFPNQCSDHTQEKPWGSSLYFETPFNGWLSTTLPKMPYRVDSLVMSFYAITAQEGVEMQVGISADDEFYSFKTIALQQNEWTKVVVPFDAYKGMPIIDVNEEGELDTTYVWGDQITLRAEYQGECTDIFVDDVTVDLIKGNLPVSNFKADSVSHDYIRYTWSTRKDEKTYRLKIYDHMVESPEEVAMIDTTLKTNVFSVPDLSPDQTLFAYVATTTENGELLWSDLLSVNTSCMSAFPLPYSENFNDWLLTKASACWTMLTNTPYSEFYQFNNARAYESNSDNYDGQYLEVASIIEDGGSAGPQWHYYALPKMDAKLDTVQLSFMIYTDLQTASVPVVGVMTDPTDTTTFVPVENIYPMKDKWIHKVVSFANYKGADGYIAFRQYYPTSVRIDDVEVSAIGCVSPSYGFVTNPTENSLTARWVVDVPAATYDVLCTDGVDSVFVKDLTEQRTLITGLKANTDYAVYVRGVSKEKEEGRWVKIGTRHTLATLAQAPYANDFSVEAENKAWRSTIIPMQHDEYNQWTIGTAAAEDTCLYISGNGVDYNHIKNQTHTYIYRPFYFRDGLHELSFQWKSPNASRSKQYTRVFLFHAEQDMNEYRKIVDYNELDPNLLAEKAVAELTGTTMNTAKSSWTQSTFSFTVPKEGAYYIAFYWWNSEDENYESQKPVAINNVFIEHISCAAPDNVMAEQIATGTELKMNWVNGSEWDLKVSTKKITATETDDAAYVADVYDGKVKSKPHTISALNPDTEYFYAIRTVCEDTTTSWTYGSVKTAYAPYTLPFIEGFKQFGTDVSELNLPNWTHYNAFLEDVFNGAEMTPLANPSWGRVDSACTMQDPHAKLFINSRETGLMTESGMEYENVKAWMVTPNIQIPEGETKLTFDLGLTQVDWDRSRIQITDLCSDVTSNFVDDDLFAVLVSTDNGKTWNRDNATIWNDKNGDYSYSALTAIPQKQTIDLSKYAGQVIQVAFKGESTKENEFRMLHLDNVRISQTIQVALTDTNCAGYAYRNNGFDIPALQVQPQPEPQIFTRTVVDDLAADTVFTLALTVGQASVDTIHATICEGEVYEQFGFRENRAGEYKNFATSSLGCDSVVVLVLKVTRAYRFEDNLTICSSQIPYTWQGQTLTESGQYTAAYTTVAGGCDSIYTLNLTVVETHEINLNIDLCEGQTYKLGEQVISETGTYAEVFTSVYGCDSVVTVNVTVHPVYNTTIEVDICQGASYEIDGQAYNRPGLYPVYHTSINGCDSIITYKLNVLEKMYTMISDTITEGEVYNKNGFENLTEEGIYNDTLVAVGGCDSIIVLTLVVEMADFISDAYTTTLTLTPNPVKRGGTVTIQQEFNAEKVKVEIFSPIGVKVREQMFDMKEVKNIRLDGFNVSGTYLVRITTQEGDLYMAKLIVQ